MDEPDLLFQMKKYLQPKIITGGILVYLAAIICVILFIFSVILSFVIYFLGDAANGDGQVAGWALPLLFAYIFTIGGILKRIHLRRQLRTLEQDGLLYRVLSDYKYAIPMHDGKILMGRESVFGAGCGAVIAYADIDKVFEYERYTYFIKGQRMFRVKMKDGELHDLCYLDMLIRKEEEERWIIRTILEHNPSVQVELKKRKK